jgi:hypothetical protein
MVHELDARAQQHGWQPPWLGEGWQQQQQQQQQQHTHTAARLAAPLAR